MGARRTPQSTGGAAQPPGPHGCGQSPHGGPPPGLGRGWELPRHSRGPPTSPSPTGPRTGPAQGPRAPPTHGPAASVRVQVAVHLQGPARVTVQVDGVQAAGGVAVLLNLAAVRGVWETGPGWEPGGGQREGWGGGARRAGPLL